MIAYKARTDRLYSRWSRGAASKLAPFWPVTRTHLAARCANWLPRESSPLPLLTPAPSAVRPSPTPSQT
ncbi:hypothetical protein GCM10020219_006130 [Nonomuraea dietziae]